MSFVNGIVNLFRFDKTNWRAVALCITAATVFWFFNALNKEHTATISFPVEFKYNESTYIPVKDLPKGVLINITGIGWDLLRRSVGFKVVPLQVSLERPSEIKKLPPGSVLALAMAQFDQLKINYIASDTLQILIDRRSVKKARLYVSNSQFQFRKDYGRSSKISIKPDSVTLSGPNSVLAQIPDSVQLDVPDDVIDNDYKVDGEIVLPNFDQVVLSNEKATIQFDVSEIIHQVKKIKVVVLPAPPFRHQLSTDSLLVYFEVPQSLSDSLQHADLFAVVDLRNYDQGTTKALPVIKGYFPFSRILSVDSIIVKKY